MHNYYKLYIVSKVKTEKIERIIERKHSTGSFYFFVHNAHNMAQFCLHRYIFIYITHSIIVEEEGWEVIENNC